MDEHISEYITDRIEIGHLFEVTDEFLAKFFMEMPRKKKLDQRLFAVPSTLTYYNTIQSGWQILNQTPVGLPVQVQPSPYSAFGSLVAKYEEDEDVPKPKAVPKCVICNHIATKSGPSLIVDEIKTGTRLKYYRVWVNGEDRYFTEHQLKYAMDIK